MAKVILDSNDVYIAASNATFIGAAGSETVKVYEGVAVVTDANVERVEFTRASTAYTFKSTSTGVQVLLNGVAVADVQAGQKLAFTNGLAAVAGTFDAATATATFTLGGQTVASTAGALTPTLTTAAGDASTIAPIDVPVVTPSTSTLLKTTQDALVGTAAADEFVAHIFDNDNTLQSDDSIDGGAGIDTLKADVGNSQNFAITPVTKNVEQVFIRAQADANDTADNNMTAINSVQIDAERMEGVTRWESNNSRADVLVEDVRIQPNQITKDITIAMVETDPGHVDFGVYFDQYSLKNVTSNSSSLSIQLMDTRSLDKGEAPLKENPYNGFTFKLDGVLQTVTSQAIDAAQTYPELLAAIQAAVAANPALASIVTVASANTFQARDTVSGNLLTGQEIVLTTTSGVITTDAATGWTVAGSVPSSSAFHSVITPNVSSSTDKVTSTIILDDVGRGSTGGDLVVGGLSIGDTSTSRGVERFEIEVRDNSKLQTINSTNNTLQEVTIKNGLTSSNDFAYVKTVKDSGNLSVLGEVTANNNSGNMVDADLPGTQTVNGGGQHNGFGFSDVRLIDASAMVGQLSFNAEITTASIGKYLNLTDTAADPKADTINFVYSGGANNDNITVAIDGAWAASNSNIVVGREDFTFTVNGGAGNDNITTTVENTPLVGNAEAWYTNQKQNANLAINAGDGNDTISTLGAGDFRIVAGAGDDTVYADNTGNKAVWVYNTADQNAAAHADRTLTDLRTDTLDSYNLYKGTLTLDFMGHTVAVTVPSSNYRTTDLQINQAIKAAINNDAVLSKLLVAADGPASTLVVTSLIDGVLSNADLQLTLTAPAASTLTATEIAALGTAYVIANPTDALVLAEMNTGTRSIATFNANADYVDQLALDAVLAPITGSDSVSTSDNTITGGAGNDVIVLGTTNNGTALTASNEVVVFATGFGYDVIANFDAGAKATGGDTLDFAGSWAANVDNTAAFAAAITSGDATFVSMTGLDTAITGTQTYSSINSLTLAQFNQAFDSVGGGAAATAQNYLVLVQQDGGAAAAISGHSDTYKVFNLTSNASTVDFLTATYMGEVEVLGVTPAAFAANADSLN